MPNTFNSDAMPSKEMTNEELKKLYDGLFDIDKKSVENLKKAEKETEESNYTSEDNEEIETDAEIPGLNDIDESSIHETEKDIKDVLSEYDLSDEDAMKTLNIIEEYKAGNTTGLYFRLPDALKRMVDGIVATEGAAISFKELNKYRNQAAKMLIDNFIHDAKMQTVVDEFNAEMGETLDNLNAEYDAMMTEAIDSVFDKIDELKVTDPEKAERISKMKKAFEDAETFDRQLEYAKNTTYKKLKKQNDRFKDNAYYFNKRVNNNTAGVKIPEIETLAPIISNQLPDFKPEEVGMFLCCICNTLRDPDDITEIAYQYRMVSSIYKYRFVEIDERGKKLFGNISKVIHEIIS